MIFPVRSRTRQEDSLISITIYYYIGSMGQCKFLKNKMTGNLTIGKEDTKPTLLADNTGIYLKHLRESRMQTMKQV